MCDDIRQAFNTDARFNSSNRSSRNVLVQTFKPFKKVQPLPFEFPQGHELVEWRSGQCVQRKVSECVTSGELGALVFRLIPVFFHHRLQPFEVALDLIGLGHFLPNLLHQFLADYRVQIFSRHRFGEHAGVDMFF